MVCRDTPKFRGFLRAGPDHGPLDLSTDFSSASSIATWILPDDSLLAVMDMDKG